MTGMVSCKGANLGISIKFLEIGTFKVIMVIVLQMKQFGFTVQYCIQRLPIEQQTVLPQIRLLSVPVCRIFKAGHAQASVSLCTLYGGIEIKDHDSNSIVEILFHIYGSLTEITQVLLHFIIM